MTGIEPFSRWLEARRTRLGLTRETLAEQVGCPSDTIRNLEAASARPSTALAKRLADALKLDRAERTEFLILAGGCRRRGGGRRRWPAV